MEKYSKSDQRLLAIWAADSAERLIHFFESTYTNDDRPRKAIETCRVWIKTGVFKMSEIRGASLASHAAARDTKENSPARFAARAAGQAVATAHVPQHAFGVTYYGMKLIQSADPINYKTKIIKELRWQSKHLPKHLREGWYEWGRNRLPKNLQEVWKEFLKKDN